MFVVTPRLIGSGSGVLDPRHESSSSVDGELGSRLEWFGARLQCCPYGVLYQLAHCATRACSIDLCPAVQVWVDPDSCPHT